jgi:hypothetical protein
MQFLSFIANCTKVLAKIEVPGLKLKFGVITVPKDLFDVLASFGLEGVEIYGLLAINASLAILYTVIGYLLFRYTAAPNYNLGESAQVHKKPQGLGSISTPNAVEIPLEERQSGRESVVSFSPFSSPKHTVPPPYGDDDSISSNGSPTDLFATKYFGDGQAASSNKRRPRGQSKIESQDPTEIYTRQDTIEQNYNSITFSDLDEYIGANK